MHAVVFKLYKYYKVVVSGTLAHGPLVWLPVQGLVRCPVVFCRWMGLQVNCLNLKAPLTVHPDVTIQETLNLLNREGFDQLPVVDESG